MSTYYQSTSAATHISRPKRPVFVCYITSCVFTVCCMSSLTTSQLPIFRLPTLSLCTTHSFSDSADFAQSALSVLFSVFVRFYKCSILIIYSSPEFNIRFQNNLNDSPCNYFVYKSAIIISIGKYSIFINYLECNQ